MRRLLSTAAAAAALFAAGAVHAADIVIDDFGLPDPRVTLIDHTINFAVTSTVNTVNPAGGIATSRDTFANRTGGGADEDNTGEVQVTVGKGAVSGNTQFILSLDSGVTGYGQMSWDINPLDPMLIAATSPARLFFDVVRRDTVTANVLIRFSSADNNVYDFQLPVQPVSVPTTGGREYYNLTAGQLAILQGGGRLDALFGGDSSFDITFDTFGLELPEPGSLALVGLALLGAGMASRRAKR